LWELLKAEFLRQCSGFVVPGRSAREYLRSLKIREELIFTAVNAVDNDLFARASENARLNASQLRDELRLPPRYFLFVGRLVREKGVFELLSAYAGLEESLREKVGLVFVGDGGCRQSLEQQAGEIAPGTIKFVGFAQREQLPTYYALGEMLILPTYTDTWGLVVNEAMACGLPVILSEAAGCAPDLVTDNWNGRMVAARNESALRSALRSLAADSALRAELGSSSRNRIAEYSPQKWCEGIAGMMSAVGRNFD
jgi:glycosyltransferase involved in cell wall biosynthesis